MEEFNSELDVELFRKRWDGDAGNGYTSSIEVSVKSYADGAPKVQIVRVNGRHHQSFYKPKIKLGRLTYWELRGVLPLLQEALTFLDSDKSPSYLEN